jgi:hypothetical protein
MASAVCDADRVANVQPDDEDVASPNFPTGLSIVPSVPPLIASVAASAATALPDHLLASIRQEEAIQRYGIAGRVWCAPVQA